MICMQVTYREGKPVGAYLFLDRRPGDKSARTERHASWVVDFSADGRAIGVEFLNVAEIELSRLNSVLVANGQREVSGVDLAPMKAA